MPFKKFQMKKKNYQFAGLSILFFVCLLLARVIVCGKLTFVFLLWNIFLSIVSYFIATHLASSNKKWKQWLVFVAWLLFFPNAPYVITDLLHLFERPNIPLWFDVVLLFSAAWLGLLFGLMSLVQVEKWFLQNFNQQKTNWLLFGCMMLSGFGVYLGRFLRFNSWDAVQDPGSLLVSIGTRIVNPMDHLRTWGFTVLFGLMIWLMYKTLQQLRFHLPEKQITA
jgi:uncharacterized membrane protein